MDVTTSRVLARFTTQYSETEDRIRLSGEVPGHGVAVLWISQRLARRLVPSLAQWLEKEAAHLPMPELRQEMAQQAAEAGLKAEPPVEAAPDVAGNLVTEVDLAFAEDATQITFKWRDGTPIILPMTKTALRQWLGILRGTFERAGWSLDIWPEWTHSKKPSALSSGPVIMH